MRTAVSLFSTVALTFAAIPSLGADAEKDAIKRAIVMDSAITIDDLRAIAAANGPPQEADCEDQSLTFMLFVLLGGDKHKASDSFKVLKEDGLNLPEAAREVCRNTRASDPRLIGLEPLSFIHLDQIYDFQCDIEGRTAKGVASFRSPGLYEGKVSFVAEKLHLLDDWYVVEFSMADLDIELVREVEWCGHQERAGVVTPNIRFVQEDGRWTRKPRKR